jgi:hypothetical protein
MESTIITSFIALITKIGGWIYALIPAIFGSAFSIYIDRDTVGQSSKIVILSTFLFGLIIGYAFGGGIIEHFGIIPASLTAFSIQFTVGWMGMAVLVGMKEQVKPTITALIKKYIG